MGSLMRSPPIGLSSESIYYLPFLQCSATSSHSFPSYYFTRRGLGFFLTPSPVWIVKTQAKLSRHRCSRVRLGSFRLDSRYRFMGRLSGLLDHLEDDQGDEHEEQQAHQNGRRHGWPMSARERATTVAAPRAIIKLAGTLTERIPSPSLGVYAGSRERATGRPGSCRLAGVLCRRRPPP